MTCGRRMAIRIKAMLKRTERNTKGDACSKAFFTTTKVTPQISEQNVSDRSAFRRWRMGGRLRQVHVSVFAKRIGVHGARVQAPRKKQMRNRQIQARRPFCRPEREAASTGRFVARLAERAKHAGEEAKTANVESSSIAVATANSASRP